MKLYVRFWAQEAYADAHAWGVAGWSLEERSAYLNDYFLHGSRLVAAGDESTEPPAILRRRLYARRQRGVSLVGAHATRTLVRLHGRRPERDAELRLGADLRASVVQC